MNIWVVATFWAPSSYKDIPPPGPWLSSAQCLLLRPCHAFMFFPQAYSVSKKSLHRTLMSVSDLAHWIYCLVFLLRSFHESLLMFVWPLSLFACFCFFEFCFVLFWLHPQYVERFLRQGRTFTTPSDSGDSLTHWDAFSFFSFFFLSFFFSFFFWGGLFVSFKYN